MTHVVEAPASMEATTSSLASAGGSLLAHRAAAAAFFDAEADRIAELCARMADRFAAGGRLIAIGLSPAARSDVRHVAVEFVHPVIVGKRALPAIGLCGGVTDVAAQTRLLAAPGDIVLAFGSARTDEGFALRSAIAAARARGCLTIAVDGLGADVEFRPTTNDPLVWQEVVETLYHVLWELVHVFFEHGAEPPAASADPGRAAFLYPFLTDAAPDTNTIMTDVSRSARHKAADTEALRHRTLDAAGLADLERLANDVRGRLDAGGTLLAFGNGGSATDAMDLVADLRTPIGGTGLSPRAAIDLTDDSSILTALTNDVGPDLVFARQIIAYARPDDVAVAFSTSGSSRNVIVALAEARRRGVATVAFTGYDGGRIAAEGLADHVVVAPSQHIPRIQEAHATAYHILRALVG